MSGTLHNYTRPTWQCLACDDPWPCPDRRQAFLERHSGDKTRLRGILGTLSLDASQDLGLRKEEAYDRFIRWTFSFEHAMPAKFPAGS